MSTPPYPLLPGPVRVPAESSSKQVGGVYNANGFILGDGAQCALQLDTNGNLKVNVIVGGGGGGGGTVIQGNKGTIAQSWFVELTDGSNPVGTFGNPLRVDPTGTTAQPASQFGNWTTRIVGATGVTLDAAQGATAPVNQLAVGGIFLSAPPTLTNGQAQQLQLDNKGNLLVSVVTGGSNASIGLTGATAPTSATEIGATDGSGKLQSLKITAAGNLQVDGSGVTQPVSGTVAVSNFPATQPVSGSVAITGGALPGVSGAGVVIPVLVKTDPTTNDLLILLIKEMRAVRRILSHLASEDDTMCFDDFDPELVTAPADEINV